MLQNAYLLAKIGADTAENERNFAKIWQLPYGSTTPERESGSASARPGSTTRTRPCTRPSKRAKAKILAFAMDKKKLEELVEQL